LDAEFVLEGDSLRLKSSNLSLEVLDLRIEALLLDLSAGKLLVEGHVLAVESADIFFQLVHVAMVLEVVVLKSIDSPKKLINLLLMRGGVLLDLLVELINLRSGLVAFASEGRDLALKVLLVLLESLDQDGLLVEVGIKGSESLCDVSK
jgi:hypothetical protein